MMKLAFLACAAAGLVVLLSVVFEAMAAAAYEEEYDPYAKPFGMP